MSGGGGGSSSPKDYFKEGKEAVGEGIADVVDGRLLTFDQQGNRQRAAFGQSIFGNSLSPEQAYAVRTGGAVGFLPGQQAAEGVYSGLLGGDRGLSQAVSGFGSYQPAAQQGVGFDPLRNFVPREQYGVGFGQLAAQDPANEYLRQVGSGDFLTPDSNPFLQAAIEAAQRPVIENYQTSIAPTLAAQFGGGFGTGSSLQINAQQRAANDLTRNLSDSATQAYAANYAQERAAMDAANQFLSGQQLQRGQSLGQLNLARAQGIDQSRLSRATSLGDLALNRAQGIDNARLQALSGLAQTGQARGTQRLQAADRLFDAGQQRRAIAQETAAIAGDQFFARNNQQLQRLQAVAPLLSTGGAGISTSSASRNNLAGAAGGALSGAAIGSTIAPGVGTAIGAVGGGLLGFL